MTWYAVCRTATGELVSVGTVLATPLPSGLTALPLVIEPDNTALTWNAATRLFVARPVTVTIDRVQDLTVDPTLGAVWTRLTSTQALALRDRIASLLGPHRFRLPQQFVNLE